MITRAWKYACSDRAANLVRRLIVILACVLTVALGLGWLMPPPLDDDLPFGGIVAENGVAYVAPVPYGLLPGFFAIGDKSSRLPESTLQLRENGRLLGPPHASHDAIRAEGGGRYSHWGDRVWFSASDSTDPRSNGRRYTVHATRSPQPWFVLTVAAVDTIAILQAWLWFSSRAAWRRWLLNCTIVAALIATWLLAVGAFGQVNAAATGEPKDGALVAAALLHALLGIAILLAQWIAGAGVARVLLSRRSAGFADVLILGFAVSLPVAAMLALARLTLPGGSSVAVALWLLCCLPLWRWRPANADWGGLAQVSIATLPLAIGFGCWMGLLWHGPTATLGGSPSGDLVFYSTAIVSLGKQIYPYLNLGYEYQPLNLYFNMLFPLLGAAVDRSIVLDPFLFTAASGSASFVLGLGLLLHLYVRGTGILADEHGPRLGSLTLLLAVLVANRYPYWVVESIPVIHAVPLTIVVVYWSRKKDVSAQMMAFVIAVIGSALSKVVAAAILAPYAAATALAHLLQMSRAARIAVAVLAALAAAYAAALLYNLGSLNFTVAPLGPSSLSLVRTHGADLVKSVPAVLRDLATVALAGVAFLLMDRLRAMAVAFGCVLVLINPFLFLFVFVSVAIIIGLVACDDLQRLRRRCIPVLAALTLGLAAVLLTDPAGPSSGIAWMVCIGGTVVIALRQRLDLSREGWVRAGAVALLLSAGLASVARGNLIVTSGWQPGLLTPKVREIWLAVRDSTPPDALVFTDQTGNVPTLLGSWNTYAFIGARQIFVSNLYMNYATRMDLKLAAEVLAQNDAVLDGRLVPDRLPLRDRYAGYYAVVSCSRPVPPAWRRIFDNENYCLFAMDFSR